MTQCRKAINCHHTAGDRDGPESAQQRTRNMARCQAAPLFEKITPLLARLSTLTDYHWWRRQSAR